MADMDRKRVGVVVSSRYVRTIQKQTNCKRLSLAYSKRLIDVTAAPMART